MPRWCKKAEGMLSERSGVALWDFQELLTGFVLVHMHIESEKDNLGVSFYFPNLSFFVSSYVKMKMFALVQ